MGKRLSEDDINERAQARIREVRERAEFRAGVDALIVRIKRDCFPAMRRGEEVHDLIERAGKEYVTLRARVSK